MYNKKKKVERKSDKYIPPAWCRDICQNGNHLTCVYDCAGKRDGRSFLPKNNLNLEDLAPFPLDEWNNNMSAAERQKIAGLYLAKLVEAVTGVPHDPDRAYIDSLDLGKLLELVFENGEVYEEIVQGPQKSAIGKFNTDD